MEKIFDEIKFVINRFKTEIIVIILVFFLIFSLIMGLQAIFIFCFVMLILTAFNKYLLLVLLLFKSIEIGAHGFKGIPSHEEIRRLMSKLDIPAEAKAELEKDEKINLFVESFKSPRGLKLSDLLRTSTEELAEYYKKGYLTELMKLVEKDKSAKETKIKEKRGR